MLGEEALECYKTSLMGDSAQMIRMIRMLIKKRQTIKPRFRRFQLGKRTKDPMPWGVGLQAMNGIIWHEICLYFVYVLIFF